MTTETVSAAPERPSIDPTPRRLLIGGRWESAAEGETYEIIDPASSTTLTSVPRAGAADAAHAAQAARAAFEESGWATMTPRARGQVLLRAVELMRSHALELAQLESLDAGKPFAFTQMIDVPTSIDTFEYYASLAAGLEGAARPIAEDVLAYTRREPLGVVAAITPFNFPLILSATKIAPALAAGNAVIHKPAEETPLTALRIAEILQEAGVPAGVFNVLTGGGEVGAALVADPRIDKVAFTGSTDVGRKVASGAAATLKRVTVELGGKSANIIFADADLEAAIQSAVQAFVFNTGQFCMAGSRLLVEASVYDDVVAGVTGACPHVPVGDPFDEGTVIGPMAGPKHLAKVNEFLDAAARDGIEIGGRDGAQPDGLYVRPAVLTGVSQDSACVQQEIFGPVVTVQRFETEAEAIALANGTSFGLAAGLQTRDVSRAHRVAAALQAGIVWVNGWGRMDIAMPFGGYKESGYGRENGPEGLDEYLHTKSVVVLLG